MIEKIKQRIRQIDPIDFAIQLTNFFIIVHFSSKLSDYAYIPIIITATIGILFHEARYSKLFWIIQAVFYMIWVINHWQLIDNHMYLWGYWLIAIFIGVSHKNKTFSIRISAQYLLCACMLFAVIQKALSPDFVNGNFFLFQLIVDDRFNFIGNIIQYDMSSLTFNNGKVLADLATNVKSATLDLGPKSIVPISYFLTWYVLIIEVIIAILFMLPRKKVHYWQHWVLLMFSTVYFLLPIKGFAFTVLIFGFTLLRKKDFILKSTYLFFFIYIFAIAAYFKELII